MKKLFVKSSLLFSPFCLLLSSCQKPYYQAIDPYWSKMLDFNSAKLHKDSWDEMDRVLNDEKYQIIITDTPGIHKPKTKLSETMIETAFTSFGDVDVILFLIEADSKEIGRGDLRIIEKIKERYDFDLIDDKIRTICIYKEKYPESSMQELAEIISSETEHPITKSCINHRFRKMREMVNK